MSALTPTFNKDYIDDPEKRSYSTHAKMIHENPEATATENNLIDLVIVVHHKKSLEWHDCVWAAIHKGGPNPSCTNNPGCRHVVGKHSSSSNNDAEATNGDRSI